MAKKFLITLILIVFTENGKHELLLTAISRNSEFFGIQNFWSTKKHYLGRENPSRRLIMLISGFSSQKSLSHLSCFVEHLLCCGFTYKY